MCTSFVKNLNKQYLFLKFEIIVLVNQSQKPML